jgi:hypothetical protein
MTTKFQLMGGGYGYDFDEAVRHVTLDAVSAYDYPDHDDRAAEQLRKLASFVGELVETLNDAGAFTSAEQLEKLFGHKFTASKI